MRKLIKPTCLLLCFLLFGYFQNAQAGGKPPKKEPYFKKIWLGPTVSVPVGKQKFGHVEAGLSGGAQHRFDNTFSLAMEAGWMHLFSKTYKNSTGQTFHTKPINEYYLQLGIMADLSRHLFIQALWGPHITFSNSRVRTGKFLEYINDYTLNFGYKTYSGKENPMNICLFYSHFHSNGDNTNYLGLKVMFFIK